MAQATAIQIPKGFYARDVKVGKKALEGQITPGEEYTIVDYYSGCYAFIGDNGEIGWVDMYGGWFK